MQYFSKPYTAITGASSGIGEAAARAFAARECSLILTARNKPRLETLKAELLHQDATLDIVLRTADLSVPENAFRLYESLRGFPLATWINNAGFGCYSSVAGQDLSNIRDMLRLNVESLTILSTLFARDHKNVAGAQLINISSCGGYTIVPTAVSYCAAKFYVSAFTEGLARELQSEHAALTAKVLAPAATKTGFGSRANGGGDYDYDQRFRTYHTSEQVAGFLLRLYDSDQTVGLVDRETFRFTLHGPLLPYAGGSAHNQKAAREG